MSLTLIERPNINNQRCNLLLRHPADKDETDNDISLVRNQEIDQSPSTSSSDTNVICAPFDMNDEENRLKTFDIRWPHQFIQPRILAKTGFYYIGPFDQVKCNFCKVQIKEWEDGDKEIDEHVRWSPNCPLLKRRKTLNKPIEPIDELNELLPPLTYDVCGNLGFDTIEVRIGSCVETQTPFPISEPITLKNIKYPQYAIEADRLKTYGEWPKSKKQTPTIMSDAGFFYSNQGDRVICFSCGGKLRDWDDDFIPWEHHALWFPKCDYVRLVKGHEYIEMVKRKFAGLTTDETSTSSDLIKSSSSPSANLTQTILDQTNHCERNKGNDSKLCKICYSNDYNTVFVPCGHVVACAKCASSMSTCPLCRKAFDNILRIFFS